MLDKHGDLDLFEKIPSTPHQQNVYFCLRSDSSSFHYFDLLMPMKF